jgi:hypothetical protein
MCLLRTRLFAPGNCPRLDYPIVEAARPDQKAQV